MPHTCTHAYHSTKRCTLSAYVYTADNTIFGRDSTTFWKREPEAAAVVVVVVVVVVRRGPRERKEGRATGGTEPEVLKAPPIYKRALPAAENGAPRTRACSESPFVRPTGGWWLPPLLLRQRCRIDGDVRDARADLTSFICYLCDARAPAERCRT